MPLSRREWIRTGVAGGMLLVLKPGCGNGVEAAPLVDAAVEDDPTLPTTYGTVRLHLDRIADLQAIGGAVTVELAPLTVERQRPFSLPSPPRLLVIHRGRDPDEWVAVASSCPHAGCPLGYSIEDDRIECPCHLSQFAASAPPSDAKACIGKVLHGPARQGPASYPATLDGNVVIVDLKAETSCGTAKLPPVAGGRLTLSIADYPELAQPGGAVIGHAAGLSHPIAIVRVSDADDAGAFSAVDAACPHRGCTVSYSAGAASTSCGEVGAGFWCACHCSQFEVTGELLVGPATQPLTPYPLTFDGQTLVVTITS